ncbi:hypothetical protein RZS08_22195, partial [Arthrospira platensis SPKY1]|nr:hypothetical protein [Arthrospira platensis SPKY1]
MKTRQPTKGAIGSIDSNTQGDTAALSEVDLLDELGDNPQLLQAVLTPPIAFNPLFVDLAGSLTAGLMLSVLVDLPHLEQWGALDMEQVMRETRMTPGELRGARQRLRDAQFLHER